MQVAICKVGNSQGVLIPKPILAQVGLEGTADLQARAGMLCHCARASSTSARLVRRRWSARVRWPEPSGQCSGTVAPPPGGRQHRSARVLVADLDDRAQQLDRRHHVVEVKRRLVQGFVTATSGTRRFTTRSPA